jgi:hypothetical protein
MKNLIDIIGPDCEKIILNYKKSFDLIIYQKKAIIDLINSRYKYSKSVRYCETNQTIKDLNIYYEDFKDIYLKYNRRNNKIQFMINCYGTGHKNNHKIHDLDFKTDIDDILYEYRVISITKNITNKSILIKLYNRKYDYALLDKESQKNKSDNYMDLDDYDSDLADLI